jgi:hypothetical protein
VGGCAHKQVLGQIEAIHIHPYLHNRYKFCKVGSASKYIQWKMHVINYICGPEKQKGVSSVLLYLKRCVIFRRILGCLRYSSL